VTTIASFESALYVARAAHAHGNARVADPLQGELCAEVALPALAPSPWPAESPRKVAAIAADDDGALSLCRGGLTTVLRSRWRAGTKRRAISRRLRAIETRPTHHAVCGRARARRIRGSDAGAGREPLGKRQPRWVTDSASAVTDPRSGLNANVGRGIPRAREGNPMNAHMAGGQATCGPRFERYERRRRAWTVRRARGFVVQVAEACQAVGDNAGGRARAAACP
jgi:hypothetical protein